VRTRSLGFLSFAHQEGDLGFVELRLALSGNAASVTDASTRKVALQRQSAETSQMGRKQVKRSFTLSQYSLKSVCPLLKGTVCTLCLRAVCAVCAVCTLFARCLHVLSALSALSACCLHVVCMLSACYLHLSELDKAGSIANCSTPIVTPIVNSDSDSDSVR
jgi:hypothetical protein